MRLACFIVLLAVSRALAEPPAHVHLEQGQRTTLHVGQIIDLQLHSGHPYTVTLEGDAFVPLRQNARGAKYAYRAVHAGNATLLIVPGDRKPGECVDCVTRHCFLTVVP